MTVLHLFDTVPAYYSQKIYSASAMFPFNKCQRAFCLSIYLLLNTATSTSSLSDEESLFNYLHYDNVRYDKTSSRMLSV